MANAPKTFVPQVSNDVPWHTAQHIKLIYQTLNNHALAFANVAAGSTTVNNETLEGNAIAPPPGPPFPYPGLGAVNNQTGVTAYTTQANDNGALIVLNDASPIAVTLNSALTTPYFTTISNQGSSTITVTPSTGTVNGAASFTIPGMSWATFYYDGINWEAESPGSSSGGGGVTSLQGESGSLTLTSAGGTVTITTPTSSTINLEAAGGGSGTIITASSSISVSSGGGTFGGTVSVPGALNTSACVVQTTAPGVPFSGSGSGNEIGTGVAQVVSAGTVSFSITLTPPGGASFTAGTYPVTLKVLV